MKQITAPDLHALLQSTAPKPLLLDVREPREYAFCHIEGSVLIPMNDVPARLAELDPAREIVCICHHGMRSASVGGYLERHGFGNIVNLVGGVDAWATQVDHDMPRY
jgi:rhodanese-related sulfurtransferase